MISYQTRATVGAAGVPTGMPVRADDVDSIAVQLLAGLTGTVSFEMSLDGTNFIAVAATPAAGGAVVTSTTAAGGWKIDTGGFTFFRVNCTAYTSGSAVVHVAGVKRT